MAANALLVEVFQQWDITITERVYKRLESKFAERLEVEKRFQAAEESK